MNRLFWGKIKPEYLISVIVGLAFLTVVMVICGILLLNLAFSYEKIEPSARVFMYALGGFSCAFGVLYPVIAVLLVRIYPKYPRLTYLFVQRYVFYQ